MHQMSPGVERALISARAWAERLESPTLRLAHYALALFDDDEGRPAMLLERAGLSLDEIRSKLTHFRHSPAAPDESVLFTTARDWSIEHRHDPEFLTDAFLLVVLRADPAFQREAAAVGLDAEKLEAILLGRMESQPVPAALPPQPAGLAEPPQPSRFSPVRMHSAR
ncbi:MAG: Clp protease N-terminal domain-containing protein [Gemmataceae bacterium]